MARWTMAEVHDLVRQVSELSGLPLEKQEPGSIRLLPRDSRVGGWEVMQRAFWNDEASGELQSGGLVGMGISGTLREVAEQLTAARNLFDASKKLMAARDRALPDDGLAMATLIVTYDGTDEREADEAAARDVVRAFEERGVRVFDYRYHTAAADREARDSLQLAEAKRQDI